MQYINKIRYYIYKYNPIYIYIIYIYNIYYIIIVSNIYIR